MRVVLPILLVIAAGCHHRACLFDCSSCFPKCGSCAKDGEERRPARVRKQHGTEVELTKDPSKKDATHLPEYKQSEPTLDVGPPSGLAPGRSGLSVDYLYLPIPVLRLTTPVETQKTTSRTVAPRLVPDARALPMPQALPQFQKLPPPITTAPLPMTTMEPLAAVAQPEMQGISMEQAEDFCRLVEQLKKQMEK